MMMMMSYDVIMSTRARRQAEQTRAVALAGSSSLGCGFADWVLTCHSHMLSTLVRI